MQELNYISFVNPPETYNIIPHARCMICKEWKPEKEKAPFLKNKDIRRANIYIEHLSAVLRRKFEKFNNSIQYAYWMHMRIYNVKRDSEALRFNKVHAERVLLAKQLKSNF